MNETTSALLADAHDIVREQLALAWRRHMERVQEVLEAQWPEQMERTLEETIAGLAARLEEQYQDAFEGRLQEELESAAAERRESIQKLNHAARRLRHFENEGQWAKTLVEATRGFCDRAVLLLLGDRALHVQAARHVDGDAPPHDVALETAPAFAAAVETHDTLVAMRSRGEMSEAIASYLGEAEAERFYLIPITTREGVVALLYADAEGGRVDADALELLAAVAGSARESRPVPSEPLGELVNIEGLPQKPEFLSWFSLSAQDRELHLKAQRFARVQVAGIRLYKSENVKNGRTAHSLYTSLKEEIDSAREAFNREYLHASETMVDYLHLELVRTLANDDVELLGSDYPGPMA